MTNKRAAKIIAALFFSLIPIIKAVIKIIDSSNEKALIEYKTYSPIGRGVNPRR